MVGNQILPRQEEASFVRPPLVYVREQLIWEYKHLVRNLEKEEALSEQELNNLGEDGWELAAAFSAASTAHYYFKRIKD